MSFGTRKEKKGREKKKGKKKLFGLPILNRFDFRPRGQQGGKRTERQRRGKKGKKADFSSS